jgi:hypothetical protein
MVPFLKVTAARASKGSLKDLDKLSQYLHVNHFLARHPEPLRIFLHFLSVKPPARHADAGDNHIVYLAAASLRGIMNVIGLNRPTDGSAVAHSFLHSWPAVWRWMQYLYFHPNPADIQTCGPSFTTNIIGISVARIISDFLYWSSPATSQVIISTKGVFQMVVKIFTEFAENQHVDQEHMKNYGVVTHILSKFIRYDSVRYVQELVDFFGSDLTQLASILLQNMELTIKEDVYSMGAYSVLTCLHSEIENNVAGLAHVLLRQKSMISVCRAFALHTSIRIPQNPTELLVSIYSSLLYFIRAADISDGSVWIVQAIRSGFIPSMLRSSTWPFTTDPLNVQQIFEILRILRTYLVYRSVLRVLGRALENPVIPLLESRMSEDISREWARFKDYFASFLTFKWAFDRTVKYSRHCTALQVCVPCASALAYDPLSKQCHRVERSRFFCLCSTCLAPYCSRSCQEHDWKQGNHRMNCQAVNKNQSGKSLACSNRPTFLSLLCLLQNV